MNGEFGGRAPTRVGAKLCPVFLLYLLKHPFSILDNNLSSFYNTSYLNNLLFFLILFSFHCSFPCCPWTSILQWDKTKPKSNQTQTDSRIIHKNHKFKLNLKPNHSQNHKSNLKAKHMISKGKPTMAIETHQCHWNHTKANPLASSKPKAKPTAITETQNALPSLKIHHVHRHQNVNPPWPPKFKPQNQIPLNYGERRKLQREFQRKRKERVVAKERVKSCRERERRERLWKK